MNDDFRFAPDHAITDAEALQIAIECLTANVPCMPFVLLESLRVPSNLPADQQNEWARTVMQRVVVHLTQMLHATKPQP